VTAARALGLSEMRIVRRHVLPAVLAPLIVSTTLGVAFAVLTESALSFLGFGVRPPHATWGNLLAGARPYLFDAPWLFLAPGLAIFSLVLGAHLVGDAVQHELRRRRAEERLEAR
jgi:peptide/nickel transport system permease protein